MRFDWKYSSRDPKAAITVALLGMATILLAGCNPFYDTTKQQYWYKNHQRAVIVLEDSFDSFRYGGGSLPFAEQLITLIGEPDYRMTLAEFRERIPKDRPLIEGLSYREWHMKDLWDSYRYHEERLRGDSKSILAESWRDSAEFSKCLLWVYDESLHFSKPLHSGDWLYRLFCCEPTFLVEVFFVERSHVVGYHYIGTSKAFFMKKK